MDAILNYQNPIIGDPDMMVIDGQFQKYVKSDLQDEALRKLKNSKAERLEIPFFLPKSSASEDFYLYRDNNNGVILFSTFEEKDEGGRNIGFTYYYKNASEVFNAKNTLETYSTNIAGKHPNRKDIVMYEKLLRLYSKHPFLTKYAGTLTIAVVAVVIALLICII